MKKIKSAVDNFLAKLSAKLYTIAATNDGAEIVEMIFMIVVVIVVIVVIFFPQMSDMLKGVFDNSNDKLDEIWNYKG